MISGLRNDWETWAQMERRNRDDHGKAFSQALRICRLDGVNLVELEEKSMAAFADEVEKFLSASASALGGEMDDLMYFVRQNKVHWREQTYGVIIAKVNNMEVTVPYRRFEDRAYSPPPQQKPQTRKKTW